MHRLRFRHVHLDFHTSPAIDGIGVAFDKARWQQTLRDGHVNSITCFAVCHHGWTYHDTRVGVRHPHLNFDLLRAQFDACKEIDVNVPIYLTAGVNNRVAEAHPEWREITHDGAYAGWTRSPLGPGFKTLCFNSPYLTYLCEQIRESASLFPGADGIFLDIISQGECCCQYCLAGMQEAGLDPTLTADRKAWARQVLMRYYRETTRACREARDDMPVFHNSGHIAKGDRTPLPYFSHLELESLPTGGWGYDHFPMSAKYSANLGLDFLGMTGKFHDTWGDFGGYKHPNALRYECAAMLAFGSKCSVGDQLHPCGQLDTSTYRIIGEAYREVEAKEPWCDHVIPVADVAILASEACGPQDARYREREGDTGAGRLLLEGHIPFSIIDPAMPFDGLKAILLPDDILVDAALRERLLQFLATGGRLILSGSSGLSPEGTPLFDIGAVVEGLSPWQPDFIRPIDTLAPDFVQSPFVMPLPSRRLRVTDGISLGDVHDPYFNRTYTHFCSHQYAPARPEASGYACGVRKGALLTFAHPVFSIYRATGSVTVKAHVLKTLRWFLDDALSVATNLPSTARISMMDQPGLNRRIVHLLYGSPVNRGGRMCLSENGYMRDSGPVEVIEDCPPLHDVRVRFQPGGPVHSLTLEPQGTPLPFAHEDNRIAFTLPRLDIHQMVVAQRE